MLRFFKDLLTTPEPATEVSGPDRVLVATCALLAEVASADEEFDETERDHIIDTLRQRFDLSVSEAKDLLELSEAERRNSVDLWKFTNAINTGCTKEEKLDIIEQVWRVIYADGTLDKHEDYLAHKLAKLLNLNHPQLIEAKMKVLDETR